MKKCIKKVLFSLILILLIFVSTTAISVNAYTYTPDGKVISQVESLIPVKSIDASNLTTVDNNLLTDYSFGSLSDIAVYGDNIYCLDSENNCCVVLDKNFHYLTRFPEGSDVTLSKPQGVYVTDEYIYICDYGNNRLCLFDKEYELKDTVLTPEDAAFEGYEFRPKKITVSRTGRMFVVAEGINEGIIDFNPDGTFSRFYGMNSATISAWRAFWLLFTSEEQRKSQGLTFGASLSNLCIDEDEYVYTVSNPSVGTNFIKRLNYKGSDVLKRNGYVNSDGDIVTTTSSLVPNEKTTFIDIDVNEDGTYIALDRTRCRIFAYDYEGNLLFTAGEMATIGGIQSNQRMKFQSPEAVCFFKDQILAVDSMNKNIIVFEYTEFGKLVNEAIKLYKENNYEEAKEVWEEVLALNSNYHLAYGGIGKALFREGDYENAMEYLKLGNDTYNYSQAYKQYRYNKLSKVAPFILGGVLLVAISLLVLGFVKSTKRGDEE